MDTVRNLVAMREDALVTVAVTAARPVNAGDGVAITSWRTNSYFAPPRAGLFLSGTMAATIGSPTGGSFGVELWGYRLSKWWLLGYINRGLDVVIVDADRGFAQGIHIEGIFERLAIAGTPSAGAAEAVLVPVEVWT